MGQRFWRLQHCCAQPKALYQISPAQQQVLAGGCMYQAREMMAQWREQPHARAELTWLCRKGLAWTLMKPAASRSAVVLPTSFSLRGVCDEE